MKPVKNLTTVQPEVFSAKIEIELQKVVHVLRDKDMVVGFAESCTGGLLSSLMTKLPGVSDIFWGSVVSYSNESKNLFLNVKNSIFEEFGAVSPECAAQMAEGLAHHIQKATPKNVVTVSLTGIAGPTGGSHQKPVGTVFVSVSGTKIATQTFHHEFVGKNKTLTREEIQFASALAALEYLNDLIK